MRSTKISPPLHISTASSTSLAASGMGMAKRVTSRSETHTACRSRMPRTNAGMTEPRLPSTLPNRTQAHFVSESTLPSMVRRSATNLLAPIVLVGETALSVLTIIMIPTPWPLARSTTFCVPRMFVLTASVGFCSQIRTCLSAAAWTTMSTPFWKARSRLSRSRTSPIMNSTFAWGASSCWKWKCLESSREKMMTFAGFRGSSWRTISAPMLPVPPVTSTRAPSMRPAFMPAGRPPSPSTLCVNGVVDGVGVRCLVHR